MTISRQERSAEYELMNALSSVILTDPPPQRIGDCPSIDELRSFVQGKISAERRELLVAHLSSCNHCIGVLRKKRERRTFIKEASLALAATAVLLLAVWIGFKKPTQTKTETATIDLRPISLTRGGEAVTASGDAPALNTTATNLRLLLSAGSEGMYECEILSGQQSTPVLHISREASLTDHQVVLVFPVQTEALAAGRYTLALRKQGSSWRYYPLIVK